MGTPPTPEEIAPSPPNPIVEEPEPEPEPEPEREPAREEEIQPPLVNKEPMINIFYKDGQKLDNCLIANSARRAELRKLRKAEQAQKEQANASGKVNPKR